MPLAKAMRVLVLANQKGGVGKTTTAINLGTALAAINERVLIIDLDPQGNASTGLGIDRRSRATSTYNVIMGDATLEEAVQETIVPRLSVVPSTLDLLGVELAIANDKDRALKMRRAILEFDEGQQRLPPERVPTGWTHPVDKDPLPFNKLEHVPTAKPASTFAGHALGRSYTYVLIDCPPSLNLLTINALAASHAVVVPLQCEFFALEGLSQLLATVDQVKNSLNPDLDIHGIVLTMYDARNNLANQVVADVRGFLGEKVYETVIPRNVRISEAPSHGKPALLYDLKCPGSQAYLKLACEVIRRERLQHAAA